MFLKHGVMKFWGLTSTKMEGWAAWLCLCFGLLDRRLPFFWKLIGVGDWGVGKCYWCSFDVIYN